jgi:hypothetical protein
MNELKNWPPKRMRPNFDPQSISGQILASTMHEAKFCPPTILHKKRPNFGLKSNKGHILAPKIECEDAEDSSAVLRLDAYMDDLAPEAPVDNEIDMDEILAILEGIPDEPQPKPKSPRRKTYGAMLNDLRMEVLNLKQEIELRDAYIFSVLHELTHK